MAFISKYKEAKALIGSLYEYIDELAADNERLHTENRVLRWENENLRIEQRRLLKVKDRYFEAGVQVARLAEKLKTENIKLKVRLDVLSKKGALKDADEN